MDLAALLRALPPGSPGKARVARWLLGARLDQRDCWVEARGGLRFKVPSLREPVGFHLLIDGVYEPAGAKLFARVLRPGMRFVDVGANIGVHALAAARHVGEGGDVLALEAAPGVFPYLAANVAANGSRNVTALSLAAGEAEVSQVPFFPAPATHFGMGSRAPQFDAAPVLVDCDTLDHVLAARPGPAVGLVKVDVEGFESGVFAGAERLLGGHGAPPVLFEFTDWAELRAGVGPGAAQRRLLDYGYRLWRLDDWLRGRAPLARVLDAGAADLLAVK